MRITHKPKRTFSHNKQSFSVDTECLLSSIHHMYSDHIPTLNGIRAQTTICEKSQTVNAQLYIYIYNIDDIIIFEASESQQWWERAQAHIKMWHRHRCFTSMGRPDSLKTRKVNSERFHFGEEEANFKHWAWTTIATSITIFILMANWETNKICCIPNHPKNEGQKQD